MRKVSLSNTFDNAQYIFNIMQNFPSMNLIIDVRSAQEFEFIRLSRSINLPYNSEFPESPDIDALRPYMRGEVSLFDRCRRFVIVIVYSPPGVAFAREVEFLLRRHKCRDVYILDEEFEVFANNYLFLCSGPDIPPHSTPKHGYPSEIVPFKLYLGDYYHASSVQVVDYLKITHIINATRSLEARFEDRNVLYLNLALEDREHEDISQFFEIALAFFENAFRDSTGRVLVHCAKGVSRSVSIVILYLMDSKDIGYEEAFEFVKKHRNVAEPNEGFVRQLKYWRRTHRRRQENDSFSRNEDN